MISPSPGGQNTLKGCPAARIKLGIGLQGYGLCLVRASLFLAHRVISRRRRNSVAFGAKRTSAAVCGTGFMSTRPRKIAEGVLSTKSVPKGMGSFVLSETHTMERPLGWVFFYTSTENSGYLAGNSPFLVHREDGGVYFLGTAFPVEESLPSWKRR